MVALLFVVQLLRGFLTRGGQGPCNLSRMPASGLAPRPREGAEHAVGSATRDRQIRLRITTIWALLFFNVMPWIGVPTVVPIPQKLSQLLTMGALGTAVLLALSLNPRLLIRPNVFLSLYSLLAIAAAMTSVRLTAGPGAVLRSSRLAAFLVVLWLLTPWWGRRDLLLARAHLRVLLGVSATIIVGLLVAPSLALSFDGRLAGVLWPIWPTAVAHYAAVAAGIAIVLWLSGSLRGRQVVLVGAGGTAMTLLSQTRIALLGLVVGLLWAGLTLFLARRRVRRALTIAVLVAPMALVVLAPAFTTWATRGQSPEEISGLTGRRQVWTLLLDAPRSEFNQWFGFGLSDKGFSGLPIDNSWLAIYQDQGLVGATVVGMILVVLLGAAAFRPAGPARSVAVFLVVYSVIDSFTEVGLGDASSYLLDLCVAASLLAPGWGAGDPDHPAH